MAQVRNRLWAALAHSLPVRVVPALALLLSCATMLLALPAVQAQETPLPLALYVELLNRAEQALADAPADERDAVLAAQVRRLAAVEAVEYPSGAVVTLEPLLGTEDATDLTVADAQARLRMVQQQIAASTNDDLPMRLDTLEAILARPEFNNPVGLLERGAIWLRNLIRRWFPNFEFGAADDVDPRIYEIILWVLSGIGIIVIIVLLSGWIRRLARALLSDAESELPDRFGNLPRTAAEARQQAQSAAQSGAYRDAVRRLYLAALLQLAEARLLPFDPSLTNREVLARLKADSPVRPYLEPVVATFDRVWYGMVEPDRTTFDDYAAAIDALERAAQRATADQGRAI